MRNMTVRRGVVAGLGAAAGALAAAAFVSTAPIASADPTADAANSIDYAALVAPTYPELTYENTLTVYSGNSYTEYITDYTGTGTPTTTTENLTLPTGETEYGSADSFSSDYLTSAGTGYDYTASYDLADLTTATGSTDFFEPLISTFGTF